MLWTNGDNQRHAHPPPSPVEDLAACADTDPIAELKLAFIDLYERIQRFLERLGSAPARDHRGRIFLHREVL